MNLNDPVYSPERHAARKMWVKPAVLADRAVHAEGHTPRSFNADGAISCSS